MTRPKRPPLDPGPETGPNICIRPAIEIRSHLHSNRHVFCVHPAVEGAEGGNESPRGKTQVNVRAGSKVNRERGTL